MSAPKRRIRYPVRVVFGHGRRNRRASLSLAIAEGLAYRTTARERQAPEARRRKAARQSPLLACLPKREDLLTNCFISWRRTALVFCSFAFSRMTARKIAAQVL